jgi:hypothetical protein
VPATPNLRSIAHATILAATQAALDLVKLGIQQLGRFLQRDKPVGQSPIEETLELRQLQLVRRPRALALAMEAVRAFKGPTSTTRSTASPR